MDGIRNKIKGREAVLFCFYAWLQVHVVQLELEWLNEKLNANLKVFECEKSVCIEFFVIICLTTNAM
jgi:hypothetical protein